MLDHHYSNEEYEYRGIVEGNRESDHRPVKMESLKVQLGPEVHPRPQALPDSLATHAGGGEPLGETLRDLDAHDHARRPGGDGACSS